MKSTEMRGKELIDAKVITAGELNEWLKAKNTNQGSVVGVGVPCYALFVCMVNSIKPVPGDYFLQMVFMSHLRTSRKTAF